VAGQSQDTLSKCFENCERPIPVLETKQRRVVNLDAAMHLQNTGLTP